MLSQFNRSTTPDSVRAVSCETLLLAYSKTKAQISCAVKAQLISTFVFPTYEPCSDKTDQLTDQPRNKLASAMTRLKIWDSENRGIVLSM